MSDSFTGTVALITGAGSGIGRAVAGQLAAEGVRLVLHDRDQDGVTAVADSIRLSRRRRAGADRRRP